MTSRPTPPSPRLAIEPTSDDAVALIARPSTFRARPLPHRQDEQCARLAERLPLPQIRLPFLFTADVGPTEIELLADEFGARHRRDGVLMTRRDSRPSSSNSATSSLCCGTGGVGKTTTAATLAIEGARRGRNAVVVTIDPAKRLANTLGLEHLSNSAHEIARDVWDPDGDAVPGGRLHALMLDTETTFDQLVQTYARNDEQASGILENRFYRNIAGALVGHAGVHGDGEALRAARHAAASISSSSTHHPHGMRSTSSTRRGA